MDLIFHILSSRPARDFRRPPQLPSPQPSHQAPQPQPIPYPTSASSHSSSRQGQPVIPNKEKPHKARKSFFAAIRNIGN
ncbi:hypothetical protein DACRYDRAFT_115872, partial [Dacryopinax primogenitus]